MNCSKYYESFDKVKHDAKVFGTKMRSRLPYNKNGVFNPGDIDGIIELIEYTGLNKKHKMVEVGSYYGASSVVFGATGASIDCIDAWSIKISDIVYDEFKDGKVKVINKKITSKDFTYIEKLFDENIKPYKNINKIKADAKVKVNDYKNESLDFVYIDANHNYKDVKEDIQLWLPKIKKGGWICGHDISMAGVSQAVTELFQLFPHSFRDTSWAIKKDKDFKNGVDIYIGTGITENYLEKAMKYLVSLNTYNNISFIKKFCITLGFNAPEYLKASLPNIQFIYKSKDSQLMPNQNSCMQHGEFINDIDAKDDDIIVFTDSDIIIQGDMNINQIVQLISTQLNEFKLSFNQGQDDTLYKEYLRLMNFSYSNKENSKEPSFEFVSNTILEQLLEFNSMEYKCYNTGVMVSTKKSYLELFYKYCELFPVIDKVFLHYAKQQYLLCYVIQKYFKASVLNKSIHTHGHAGIPDWAIYNYHTGEYLISAQAQGYKVLDEDIKNSISSKIIFRHNLWNKKINITYLNVEKEGCGAAYYRIGLPYKTLQSKYESRYNIVPCEINKTNMNDIDIIVCQRAMNLELFCRIRQSMRDDAILIWDGDDDYFNIDDRNPHTESFKDPKMILGINSFISNANLITTSTQYLKGVFSEHTKKRIEVFPNALDYKLWDKNLEFRKKNKKNDGYIRIGWQGGDSHTKDMRAVYKTILNIMLKYNNIILVVVGWDFTNFTEFWGIKDRIEHIGWSTYHERYVQNIIDFDIGIAPLDQNIIFNKSKSNIKWLEYSALEIPTIASNELPYSEIINNNTGLIIDNTENNWYNALVELIENKDKRDELGKNARQWTRERYDIKNMVDIYDKVFMEIKG